MKARSSVHSIIVGMATAGSLGLTAISASAQAIYVDPYVMWNPTRSSPPRALTSRQRLSLRRRSSASERPWCAGPPTSRSRHMFIARR
jgi:hypothetical protein